MFIYTSIVIICLCLSCPGWGLASVYLLTAWRVTVRVLFASRLLLSVCYNVVKGTPLNPPQPGSGGLCPPPTRHQISTSSLSCDLVSILFDFGSSLASISEDCQCFLYHYFKHDLFLLVVHRLCDGFGLCFMFFLVWIVRSYTPTLQYQYLHKQQFYNEFTCFYFHFKKTWSFIMLLNFVR